MSRSITLRGLPAPHGGSWIARALVVVGSVLAETWRDAQLRRDRRLLAQMDGRSLADLGIGRGEIDAVLHHGRSDHDIAQASRTEAEWSLWHRHCR